MRRGIEMTATTHLRLPAAELAKLEPARSRGVARVEPPAEPILAPHSIRRAVRTVVGFARG
jgi:hypothetical protein